MLARLQGLLTEAEDAAPEEPGKCELDVRAMEKLASRQGRCRSHAGGHRALQRASETRSLLENGTTVISRQIFGLPLATSEQSFGAFMTESAYSS